MNNFTRVLLVCLRLAIGWHLFVEGVVKVQSVQQGPSQNHRPWTSRGYLANATGPFADWFRALANDLELQAAEWLRLPQSPTPWTPPQGQSARMEAACDSYLRQFIQSHGGGEVINQWHRDLYASWKKKQGSRKRPVTIQLASGPTTVEMPFVERVRRYHAKNQEFYHLQSAASVFGKEVNRGRVVSLKAELQRERDALLAELDEEARGLANLLKLSWLATHQRTILVPFVTLPCTGGTPAEVAAHLFSSLPRHASIGTVPDKPFDLGAAREPPPSLALQQIDFIVRWGLTLSGAGLLLGLLTRSCCLFAAALLLLFYLAMPPWPGLPANPMAEGTYLVVNKTLIEAVALMMLATTASGRWLGIDALLHPALRGLVGRIKRKWDELVAAEAAGTLR
jgi:uncharacterized membrane protein YphA (DoxX/SURF4 family)